MGKCLPLGVAIYCVTGELAWHLPLTSKCWRVIQVGVGRTNITDDSLHPGKVQGLLTRIRRLTKCFCCMIWWKRDFIHWCNITHKCYITPIGNFNTNNLPHHCPFTIYLSPRFEMI